MAVQTVTPAEGPSLGTAPSGEMNVNVLGLVEVRGDAQLLGVGADVAQRRMGGFLHHIA